MTDYYLNTTSGTATSAVRAASYVRQEIPFVPLPDQVSASSNVSWGPVAVAIAFSFQASDLPPAIYPEFATASAVSSSGLFFGANLAPVAASAIVLQTDTPEPPPSGGGAGLRFYWG